MMKLKATKLQKLITAFVVLALSGGITAIFAQSAQALDLDNSSLPYEFLNNVEVSTFYKDVIRTISWNILIAIANLIDYIDQGVNYLMGARAFALVKDAFPAIDTHPLVVAIISLSVGFAGLLLMFNVDKLKISDTMRNILAAGAIIIALPTLTSSLNSMRQAGVNDAKSINYNSASSGNSTYHGLGESILAKNTIDMEASANASGTLYYYSDTGAYNTPKGIYSLRYTAVVNDNSIFHQKVIDVEMEEIEQIVFTSMTMEEAMQLLGLSYEYSIWNSPEAAAWGNGDYYVRFVTNTIPVGGVSPIPYVDSFGGLHWRNPNYDPSDPDSPEYIDGTNGSGYDIQTHYVLQSSYYKSQILGKEDSYVDGVPPNSRGIIAQARPYYANGQISDRDWNSLINSRYPGDGIRYIKNNLLFDLNVSYNEDAATNVNYGVSSVTVKELVDQYTWDAMDPLDKISSFFTNGFVSVEKIYKYHVNFWEALITLLLVGISLIFAGIKLAGMLYEIVFINLIAPIVVATDATGNGRAKKMITELVTSYVLFIVVVFILKIYIYSIDAIISANINLIAKFMLIIAGAKFVIDGPDIIVKLTGSDAGIKSGYGALMGVRAAVQTARSAGHSAVSGAKSVGGAAFSVGKSGIGGVAGAAVGTASAAKSAYHSSQESGNGTIRSALNAAASAPAGTVSGAIGGAFGKGGDPVSRGIEAGEKAGSTLGSSVSSVAHQAAAGKNGAAGSAGVAVAGAAGAAAAAISGAAGSSTKGEKGDKGDTGATGAQGAQGEQGAAGAQGEQGTAGAQGEQGTQGEQGVAGAEGQKGEQGSDSIQQATASAQSSGGSSASYGNAFGSSFDSSSTSSSPVSSVSSPVSNTSTSSAPSTYAEQARSAELNIPTYAEQERAKEHERPQSNLRDK